MIWFTADLHLGHKAVIQYAKRPFTDVEDMDAGLIARWNQRVSANDQVYIVGDLSFHKPARTAELLKQMNGLKTLVPGNHDKDTVRKYDRIHDDLDTRFALVEPLYRLKALDADATSYDRLQRIVLCHYAMRVWEGSHHGTWQLYGHSHGSLADDPHALSMDVGVDSHNYAPVSYAEVKAIMQKKDWKPVDHHGAER